MAKTVRAYCFIGTFSCVHGNDALAATSRTDVAAIRCRSSSGILLASHQAIAEGETAIGLACSRPSCPLPGALRERQLAVPSPLALCATCCDDRRRSLRGCADASGGDEFGQQVEQ